MNSRALIKLGCLLIVVLTLQTTITPLETSAAQYAKIDGLSTDLLTNTVIKLRAYGYGGVFVEIEFYDHYGEWKGYMEPKFVDVSSGAGTVKFAITKEMFKYGAAYVYFVVGVWENKSYTSGSIYGNKPYEMKGLLYRRVFEPITNYLVDSKYTNFLWYTP